MGLTPEAAIRMLRMILISGHHRCPTCDDRVRVISNGMLRKHGKCDRAYPVLQASDEYKDTETGATYSVEYLRDVALQKYTHIIRGIAL